MQRPTTDQDTKVTIDQSKLQSAIQIQNQFTNDFLEKPGIVGVGTGIDADGNPKIVVYAVNSKKAKEAKLPSHAEGIPVKAKVTGMFVAGSDPTTRARPAPVGFSMGHPDITAGTYGARVKDGSGNVYALSNNHVLADVNNASIGDNILQPGPTDGGTNPDDKIGELADYEPIDFDNVNYMDAAIASSSTSNLDASTPSDAYGVPGTTTKSASVGMAVQKYGRTTQHTTGEVAEINVSVSVCYETAGPFNCKSAAQFEDQIGITPGDFSDGGDSGSLIVTDDSNKNPVGLLFAGSDTRTLANPIDRVLNRFNVTIDDGSGDGGGGDTNSAPTASFTYSCTDLSCSFDGSGSSDSDGTITSYDWDFGDGNTGSGETVSHTYASGGTYTVTLTVTDDSSATDTDSQDVSVSSSTSGAPAVDGISLSENNSGGSPHADFDASWSVSDSDGDLNTVDLTLYELDSNGNRVATESSTSADVSGSSASGTSSLNAKHDENSGNTYEVEIVVTDSSNNTDSNTATEVEDGS